MDAQAAVGNDLFRSVDRDGDARRAGLLGQIEWAVLEGQKTAIGRTPSLNKRGDVDASGEDTAGLSDTLLRGFNAATAIDGDELSELHAVAEDWELEERPLG